MENRQLKSVSNTEVDKISRLLLVWLNKCPAKPEDIDLIRYEYLAASAPAMALSTIQGAYITHEYILGGYEAEYQFKLIYRINAGMSNDIRLKADEALNSIGDWAADIGQRPNLGDSINVRRIECASRASIFAAYDNGDEDHQIIMKLTYEVNV